MAYIGNIPADKYQTLQKQSFTTSATDTYTLSYAVTNPQDLGLYINNVYQNPHDAYSVSNTTLTLSSSISGSDTMYAIFLGKSVETVAPAIGSVTNSMLAGSIANAKLANSSVTVNGTSIALGASGTISAGITVADNWRLTSNFTATANTNAFITANLEQDDTSGFANIGSSMTESSGVFTFPTTGIYYVILTISENANADHYFAGKIWTTNDNSNYTERSGPYGYNATPSSTTGLVITTSCFFDVTNTSNCKVKFGYETNTTANISGNSNINRTFFTFIRLGDT